MGDIVTFAPRPRPAAGPAPVTDAEIRQQIEAGAQAALDMADDLIALLDRLDGEVDREDGNDTEPSLGAPEGGGSQVVWLRGCDNDREATGPEPEMPDAAIEADGPLPWSGRGNIITAAGAALLGLVGRG